jgi:preprotein translocase subunit SecE
MKLVAYFKETYSELIHKVTWPSWEELQESAILVMIASVIFAIVIAIIDFIFKSGMEKIYGLFF